METEGPLKCATCGAEFTPPEGGGVCALCLRPHCRQHLAPPQGEVVLCRVCGGAPGE